MLACALDFDSPGSASRSRYIRTALSGNSWSYFLAADIVLTRQDPTHEAPFLAHGVRTMHCRDPYSTNERCRISKMGTHRAR